MKAQKYKIIGSGSATSDKIHIGQFVHRDTTDASIRGYVSALNPYSFDIILFEPDEIPNNSNFIVIHETMSKEEVEENILLTLSANHELLPMWQKISDQSKD